MRIAPSRRMVSPFSMSFSMIARASCAYSTGRPKARRKRHHLAEGVLHVLRHAEQHRGLEDARRDSQTRMPLRERSRAIGSVMPTMPPLEAE